MERSAGLAIDNFYEALIKRDLRPSFVGKYLRLYIVPFNKSMSGLFILFRFKNRNNAVAVT